MKALLIKLKGLLGFCQSKGCKERSVYDVEVETIKVKRHLCETHATRLMKCGTLKSVTYERTVELD